MNMRIKRKNLFLIIEKYLREQDVDFVQKDSDTMAFSDPKFDNLTHVSEEDIKKGITLYSEIGEMLFAFIKMSDSVIKFNIDAIKKGETAMNKMFGGKSKNLIQSQSKKITIFGKEIKEIEDQYAQYSSVVDINKVVESEIRKALKSSNYDEQEKIRKYLLDANKIHKTYKNLLNKTKSYVNRADSIAKGEDTGALETIHFMFEFFFDLLLALEGLVELNIEKPSASKSDRIIIDIYYMVLASLNDLLTPIREYKKTADLIMKGFENNKSSYDDYEAF